jgi:hypothetical protein
VSLLVVVTENIECVDTVPPQDAKTQIAENVRLYTHVAPLWNDVMETSVYLIIEEFTNESYIRTRSDYHHIERW